MTSTEIEEQAINQALAGNWQEAADLNLKIIKQTPQDIDALCRLAKAYTELDKKQLAIKTYKKVLKLDTFNEIAKKNMEKFSKIKISKNRKCQHTKIKPSLFLEEPGKTKIVSLIRLGLSEILLELNTNCPVTIITKKRSISIYNENNNYLGKLPDDISLRLIKLIRSGNEYEAVVKSVDEKRLLIFITEVKRSKKNSGIPSFPLSKDQYYSFIPEAAIAKREPIEEIEKPQE